MEDFSIKTILVWIVWLIIGAIIFMILNSLWS